MYSFRILSAETRKHAVLSRPLYEKVCSWWKANLCLPCEDAAECRCKSVYSLVPLEGEVLALFAAVGRRFIRDRK
jgi:hypothetical protein